MNSWLLLIVVASPLAGIAALFFPRRGNDRAVHWISLASAVATLGLTFLAAYGYFAERGRNPGNAGYLLVTHVPWMASGTGDGAALLDIGFRLGVDGISIWLLMLTGLLTPLAILASFSGVRQRVREYYIHLLLLHAGLLGVFCATDLLLFFMFFEFTLIPLFFLIGIWGGPERRKAAAKFFLYTICGSVLTFAGIIYLAYFSFTQIGSVTLNLETLTGLGQAGLIPRGVQWWLFLAFAAGFAIKVPLFPLHTWLPLAHTEAPTAGSVMLAGVLLKLGTYGFCRLNLPLFPDASREFAPLMAMLAIVGIVYAALAAWVQSDIKKLVAYSSVSHLGFCVLGLFSLKVAGVGGSVLYMINHGLSTGALFLVVGCIYERYHTRNIHEIGGLARKMPWLAFFLVCFTLSSIGLPGLNGFVGEFLVLLGTTTSPLTRDGRASGPLGFEYAVPAALGIILGAVYMLWMCQRVLFGPLKEPPHTPDGSSGLSVDLTRREKLFLAPLLLACVFLGVYPRPVLQPIEQAIAANILPSDSAVRQVNSPSEFRGLRRTALHSVTPGDPERMPVAARDFPLDHQIQGAMP